MVKIKKKSLNAVGVSDLNITTVWYLSYGTVKFGTEQHTASTCRVECTLKMEAQCCSEQNVFPVFVSSTDAVSSTVYTKIQ